MSFIKNNLRYIIPAVLAVISLAYISLVVLPSDTSTQRIVPIPGNQPVRSLVSDLTFSYPGSDTGLTLLQPPVPEGGLLEEVFILMPTQEYIVYQGTSTESGGESPAAISLFVYTQPEQPEPATGTPRISRIDRLRLWATDNERLTSITQATSEIETVEVDGLPMLRYGTPGLYQQDIYLGSYRDHIFMFVGQYDGQEDPMRQQFVEIINSVRFE